MNEKCSYKWYSELEIVIDILDFAEAVFIKDFVSVVFDSLDVPIKVTALN